jgi:hypothetical protein
VRTIVQLSLAFCLFLTAGCDPGMTIRQADVNPVNSPNSGLAIHVKASHPFIGENWYAPAVEIANSSDSQITVTRAELAVQQATLGNKPRHSGSYPLQVLPGRTGALDVWFDLGQSMKRTFAKPVELRVYYRHGNSEQISRATLISGPPDTDSR